MKIRPFDTSRGVAPEIDAKFKAECANRMRIVNKLNGAPGQFNRNLLTDFIQHKKWGQTPEDWALYALPKDDAEFHKLFNEIQAFHEQRAQSDLAEEVK